MVFSLKSFIMATIKFYPYSKQGKSKIYVRVLIGKTDIRLSTGLDISDVSSWSADTQRPKKTQADLKALKKRLDSLEDEIINIIDTYTLSEDKGVNQINSKLIKSLIAEFNNDAPIADKNVLHIFADHYAKSLENRTFKRKGIDHKYKPSTIYKYQNFANVLKEFSELKKNTFLISDVNNDFAGLFLTYLKDVRDSSINTQGKFIRRLKTIVKYSQQQGYKVDADYQNIKSFEDENIVTYLNFDELDKLQNVDFDNERLEIARDVFIISCFSGQRISDVQRFHKGQIETYDGVDYLCFKQYKTNRAVEIPIHYKVKAIIKKYKGFPPRFSDNLQSNRAILSTLIKKACMLAKINEKVQGRYNGKKAIYPKYKLISNHTGRKSFASNFYGLQGWTLPTVMAITGHQSERSFLYYIDREDNTLARRAGALFNQIEQDKKSENTDSKVISINKVVNQ
jgi:integrase